jgi:hypothetical protein
MHLNVFIFSFQKKKKSKITETISNLHCDCFFKPQEHAVAGPVDAAASL